MLIYHSAGANSSKGNRFVGPRECILAKNDNKKKFSKNPELLNGETWGAAWGAGGILHPHIVSRFASFSKKTHFFKAREGPIKGGRMGGR